MTRSRLATLLGVIVAISSVLVLLAGSDLPPPPGFVLILPVAVGVGLIVRVAIPRLLETMDAAGPGRALGYAVGAGMAAGFLTGLLFAALGSGEPSAASPALAQIPLFVVLVAVVGGCAAGAVCTVAILADRASTKAGRLLAVTVPALLVLLGPALVIADRFPG